MKEIIYKIEKASISVEASYVVPIILGVIFAVMTVSFYFYDIVAAQASLNKSLGEMERLFIHPCKEDLFFDYSAVNERFMSSWNQDSETGSKWKEKIDENLSKSLILLKKSGTEIELKKNKINASVELSCLRNIPFVNYIPFLKRTKQLSKTVTKYYPADFARLISIVEEGSGLFGSAG